MLSVDGIQSDTTLLQNICNELKEKYNFIIFF